MGNSADLPALARGDYIDLAVSDLTMETMTGLELAKAIHELHPALPVLLISGYSRDNLLAEHCLDKSDGFLQKPFTMSELLDSVEKLLNIEAPAPQGAPR